MSDAAPRVWLWRVVAPDVYGDHWGVCDAPSKPEAIARIRRRMRQHLETEGHGEFPSGSIQVEVWEHDFFTIAGGYL